MWPGICGAAAPKGARALRRAKNVCVHRPTHLPRANPPRKRQLDRPHLRGKHPFRKLHVASLGHRMPNLHAAEDPLAAEADGSAELGVPTGEGAKARTSIVEVQPLNRKGKQGKNTRGGSGG